MRIPIPSHWLKRWLSLRGYTVAQLRSSHELREELKNAYIKHLQDGVDKLRREEEEEEELLAEEELERLTSKRDGQGRPAEPKFTRSEDVILNKYHATRKQRLIFWGFKSRGMCVETCLTMAGLKNFGQAVLCNGGPKNVHLYEEWATIKW